MGEKTRGTMVIIGGAEDKHGECVILRRVAELAGGPYGRMAIVTAAASEPEMIGEEYRRVFTKLGVGEVNLLHIHSREQAMDPSLVPVVSEATGFFFTGGDQLRITSVAGGSLLYELIHRRYHEGVVIAGTSAGASAMSDIMIIGGHGDDAPKKCTTMMAPGMGFLEEVVIDQHFAQRGRVGRLLSAIAQNPHVLGIGIDEDTAIVVNSNAYFEVIGSQAVTVLDGRSITYSNTSELEPDEPLALTHVILHVLPAGYKFDLKRRLPIVEGKRWENE